MRSFFRFIISIFIVLGFTVLLILSTIRFQILNNDFFVNNLNKEGVYEHSSRALRLTFRNILREIYANEENIVLEELTVGERSQIERDINRISNAINAATLKDFLEANIIRVLSYAKGEKDILLLYLPLEKWGFPDDFITEEPMSYFSENTKIEEILVSYGYNTKLLIDIRYYISQVKNVWIGTLGALLLLLTIHYLLEIGTDKIKKTGYFLIKIGILYAGTCLLAKVMADYLKRGLYYWKEPHQILASAFLPPFIEDILRLWIIICVATIILGILLIAVNFRRMSRKQIKENMKATLNKTIV